jgi:uncharacterized protein YjcR
MIHNKRIHEFERLYIAGGYNNRELAARFGVSAQTICKWLKKSRLIKYHRLKEDIENELDKLIFENNYSKNSGKISGLLLDIERVKNIIKDYGTRI